jgi:antitoxin VapB
MSFLSALVSFDSISLADLNRCLVAWQHKMGPWERPDYKRARFFGMRHDGELVAVLASDQLMREKCGGLTRDEAFELGRVCAVREHLNRAALRLWREFVFPALCREHGWQWVISYQDAALHSGDLYRFDGWVRLGFSHSGTDQRSGKRGRDKVIWGWHADLSTRRAAQVSA